MWMPTTTRPLPSPCTESASSISVVAESSIENAVAGARASSSRMRGTATSAKAAEVVRRREQAEQRGRLLGRVGLGAEVVARQLGERELAFGRELPGEIEVDLAGDPLGRAEQRLGLRGGETEQHVGGLDLAA